MGVAVGWGVGDGDNSTAASVGIGVIVGWADVAVAAGSLAIWRMLSSEGVQPIKTVSAANPIAANGPFNTFPSDLAPASPGFHPSFRPLMMLASKACQFMVS